MALTGKQVDAIHAKYAKPHLGGVFLCTNGMVGMNNNFIPGKKWILSLDLTSHGQDLVW